MIGGTFRQNKMIGNAKLFVDRRRAKLLLKMLQCCRTHLTGLKQKWYLQVFGNSDLQAI